MKIKLAAFAAAIAFVCAPVWAGTINFNFGSCAEVTSPTPCTENASLGTNSAVFTVGSSSVEALTSPTSLDLYVKNITGNTSEMGLGIAQGGHNELESGQTIFLNLVNVHGAFSGMLTIGSAQNEEGAMVCVTSTFTPGSGTCTTMYGSTSNTSDILTFPVKWGGLDQILAITSTNMSSAPKGDVLVDGLTATTVPEPSSMLLFGTMLLGIGLVYGRLRRAKASR